MEESGDEVRMLLYVDGMWTQSIRISIVSFYYRPGRVGTLCFVSPKGRLIRHPQRLSLPPSLRCGPCDCLVLLAGSSCPRRPPLDRKLDDESVSTNLDVSARGWASSTWGSILNPALEADTNNQSYVEVNGRSVFLGPVRC